MRVMITGASGFIGSNVLDYLLDHSGIEEFICPITFRHLGAGSRMPLSRRVIVFYHDLRGKMPEGLIECDMILHLASESHVDRSIEDPVHFIENNISSTLQVLEYARRVKPKLFILFSTDEVYGPHDHRDWDVLLPSNPYAASKAAQEMIAIAYWRTYGVPVVITNSNNIIGPDQDPEKFVPRVIRQISQGKPVTLHVTEDGKYGVRHYNPVQNVANALQQIMRIEYGHGDCNALDDRPSRYELPGGEELDNLQMAAKIAYIMGEKLVIEKVPVEGVRPGYDQTYAPTHGERLLARGWEPVMSVDECLKEIVNAP